MPQIRIVPSILSADFGKLAEEIKKSEEAGVDGFHLDIMDGHFVPNISFGPFIAKKVRSLTKLPLDAHLMIDNPDLYIDDFIKTGVNLIFLQIESYDMNPPDVKKIKSEPRKSERVSFRNAVLDIKKIRSQGVKAGMTINPSTPFSCIEKLLPELDAVLVMSVNPGFSGQSFMSEVLPKIREIRKNFTKDIWVDGGINDQTAPKAVAAGANVLITASYFYGSRDYKGAISLLKK